jgi:hypothetical protein
LLSLINEFGCLHARSEKRLGSKKLAELFGGDEQEI